MDRQQQVTSHRCRSSYFSAERLPSYDASFTSQTDYLQPKSPRANTHLDLCHHPVVVLRTFCGSDPRPQNPVSFIRCNHNRAITKHGSPSVTHCPLERVVPRLSLCAERSYGSKPGKCHPHGRPPGRSYKKELQKLWWSTYWIDSHSNV